MPKASLPGSQEVKAEFLGRGESMNHISDKQKEDAIANFRFKGALKEVRIYGNGHINDTFLLTFDLPEGNYRAILQRMNRSVFKEPGKLMENIEGVTAHLRKKIIAEGGNPDRETLNVISTVSDRYYYEDSKGDFWRAYQFIEGATSYEQVKSKEDFYNSAFAFGRFQYLLSDYPAESLHETIKGFHDTEARLATFKEAVRQDLCKRAFDIQEEIAFVLERQELANVFASMLKAGELPLRVTHNDTKLNNIMIDDITRKGICVIDLDTVMAGLAMNDFGDAIRFGANTAAEDERDLSKVSLDTELFEVYVRGYIEGCGGKLTDREISLLPMGAKVMTYECGMRFLTDYLQGDSYFKIHRPHHNLDRSRTQFALLKDMEDKWECLGKIVDKYRKAREE